jgi:integrase
MVATKYTGVKYHDAKDGTRSYYIQYKHNGKVVRQKVGTKAEGITPLYCRKLRDETLVKLRLGQEAPISSKRIPTLKEVSDAYFTQSEARSKGKLESVYKTHLSQLNDVLITDIDDDVIIALKRKKSKEKSAKTKRILSAKTVNNILATLSAILHYAKKQKHIPGIPTIEKFKVDNTRERFLSKDEINALITKVKLSNLPTTDRLLLFTKLSLRTGGRLGSILSIKGKDINRSNRTITLQNHKTGKTYTSFLPADLMEEIPCLEPQNRLFDVASEKQIQRPLQGILNKLFNDGLNLEDRKERVVIHTLRHTFASHLAINGTPIQTIMKLMDHSDIKMTLRYAKLMPDSGRVEVEDLYK